MESTASGLAISELESIHKRKIGKFMRPVYEKDGTILSEKQVAQLKMQEALLLKKRFPLRWDIYQKDTLKKLLICCEVYDLSPQKLLESLINDRFGLINAQIKNKKELDDE
jgi:hypothetical protein